MYDTVADIAEVWTCIALTINCGITFTFTAKHTTIYLKQKQVF